MRYEKELAYLVQWCDAHHIACQNAHLHALDAYLALLWRYQTRTNLVGSRSVAEIVSDLCIDSLQILRTGPLQGTCIDVGSGAGFPAIVLKIFAPEQAFHLIEPRTKRYAFLQLVVRELDLKNIVVHNQKIENLTFDRIDFAISKAFAPLPDWIRLAAPWAEQGAQIACLVSIKDWMAYYDELVKNYRILGSIEEASRVYARIEKRRSLSEG